MIIFQIMEDPMHMDNSKGGIFIMVRELSGKVIFKNFTMMKTKNHF
jgi:hypothetical protein